MLTLHQLFVKTGLVFLMLGTLLGAFLQVREAFGVGASSRAETVHIPLMAIGFVLMLIMGVAYWMFPPLRRLTRRNSIFLPTGSSAPWAEDRCNAA